MTEKIKNMDPKTLMLICAIALSGGNLGMTTAGNSDSTQIELNKKQLELNSKKLDKLETLHLNYEGLKYEVKSNSKKLDDQDKKLDEILREMRKK